MSVDSPILSKLSRRTVQETMGDCSTHLGRARKAMRLQAVFVLQFAALLHRQPRAQIQVSDRIRREPEHIAVATRRPARSGLRRCTPAPTRSDPHRGARLLGAAQEQKHDCSSSDHVYLTFNMQPTVGKQTTVSTKDGASGGVEHPVCWRAPPLASRGGSSSAGTMYATKRSTLVPLSPTDML